MINKDQIIGIGALLFYCHKNLEESYAEDCEVFEELERDSKERPEAYEEGEVETERKLMQEHLFLDVQRLEATFGIRDEHFESWAAMKAHLETITT